MRLENKVAIISGGARGMGAQEARLFAGEGAKVVIGDVLDEEGRRTEAEINETGAECLFVHLDVTSEDDWRSAVAAAVSRFGKVDILVNNAGISSRGGIEDITEAQWERTMDINVKGVFLGTREVIPAMREAGGGSIINISSGAGIAPAPGTSGAYAASKGAVRLFTKSTAIQYAGEGIRCNSVHPGPIQTPMLGDTPDDEVRIAAQVGRVPLGPSRPTHRNRLRRSVSRQRRIILRNRLRTGHRRRADGAVSSARRRVVRIARPWGVVTMTTAAARQPQETRPKPPRWTRAVAIPLAGFGKSLDDPDLDQWFEGFAERNSDMAEYEISNTGYLMIREPTGYPGTVYELRLAGALLNWTDERGGMAFGSTSLFILPDGSRFGPDAAWIREERMHELALPENDPFPRIVPDFVAEIKSPSNADSELRTKIDLFLEHGARLAWFIDADTRTVIKFRLGQEPETLHDPEYIDDDDGVLPGFRFAVRERIFDLFTTAE